jgi:deoxyribonuclease V
MLEELRDLPDLELALAHLLAQIPAGRVTTYGAMARALGDVAASRWIGERLRHHGHDTSCPCHRVVRAGGELGGFVGGLVDEKTARLRYEGIPIEQGCVNLARWGFDAFQGDEPLRRLKQAQDRLRADVVLRPPPSWPAYVGGLDVSYGARAGEAVAAYTLVELDTGKLVWSATLRRRVTFPYISSFLAFRELPILLELMGEASRCARMADVIMVDGSGVLHPRRAGIATILGVAIEWPTIGITKSRPSGRLCQPDLPSANWQPVMQDNELLGAAILPSTSAAKPLYVSPGHLMDLESSVRIVQMLQLNHRLPEPIYLADRLSRYEAAGRIRALRKRAVK